MRRFALAVLLLCGTLPAIAAEPVPSPKAYEFLMAKMAADQGDYDEALSRLDRLIAQEPTDTTLLYERAATLAEAGKIERAERELRNVVKLDPKFYEAQRMLGRILLDRARGKKEDTEAALEHLRAAWEAQPGDISTGLTVSQLLVTLGRNEEAATVLGNLVERAPDQRSLNYTYAQLLTRLGRANESQPYLERAVTIDPSFAPAVLQLVDLYRQSGEFLKAAAVLQPLIEQDPTNADLQRQQALFYLRGNEPEKARGRLAALVEADPTDLRSKYYLAEALSDLQRSSEAEAIYREVLEKSPQDPDLLASFAMNQLAQRKYDEATRTLNSLLAVPGLPPGMMALARTQLALVDYQKGDYASALRRAREVLEYDGRPNGQAINIALDVLKRQKQYDEALALIAPLAKSHPNDPLVLARHVEMLLHAGKKDEAAAIAQAQSKVGKKATMTVAEAYVEAGFYTEAIALLEPLLAANPDDADVLFEIGAFNERAGHDAEAEKMFLRLLEKNPDHATTLNYLGYMWADKGVNLDRAQQMLETAVSQQPENAAFLDSLGWLYFKQGKLDLAEKYLTQATKLLPTDATVLTHLADVFARRGNYEAALQRYRTALTLNPEAKDEESIRIKIAEAEKRVTK